MEKVSHLDTFTRREVISFTAFDLLKNAQWNLEQVMRRRDTALVRQQEVVLEGERPATLCERRLETKRLLGSLTTNSFSLLMHNYVAPELGLEVVGGYMYLPYRDYLFIGSRIQDLTDKTTTPEWIPAGTAVHYDEFWRLISNAKPVS